MGGEDPAVNAGNKYPMSMSVPKASPILIPSSQARNSSVCHPAIVMLALSLPFPSFPSHGLPYPQKSHKGQSRADRRAIQTFAPDHRTDLPQHVLPSFLPYIATAITKTKSVIASEET